MKIPELYVCEVVWAINGLDYQVSKIAKTYSRRMKIFHAKYAFFFFSRTRRDDLSRAMLSESMAVLKIIQGMQELKGKFLESTGVNEDMSLVTFAEMIEQGIHESRD